MFFQRLTQRHSVPKRRLFFRLMGSRGRGPVPAIAITAGCKKFNYERAAMEKHGPVFAFGCVFADCLPRKRSGVDRAITARTADQRRKNPHQTRYTPSNSDSRSLLVHLSISQPREPVRYSLRLCATELAFALAATQDAIPIAKQSRETLIIPIRLILNNRPSL